MQNINFSALSVKPATLSRRKVVLLAVGYFFAAFIIAVICMAIFGESSAIGSNAFDYLLAGGIAGWALHILLSKLKTQKVDLAVFAQQNGWHYTGTPNDPELVDFMSDMGFPGKQPQAEFLVEGNIDNVSFQLFLVIITTSKSGSGMLPAIQYYTILRSRQPLPVTQPSSDLRSGVADGWNYVVYDGNVITADAMRHALSVVGGNGG